MLTLVTLGLRSRGWRNAKGQGLTEYALIIGLLALAVVAALGAFGNQLVAYYITEIGTVLDTV